MGENDDCRAYLVGEPHKGLMHMLQMMNEARIDVAWGLRGSPRPPITPPWSMPGKDPRAEG